MLVPCYNEAPTIGRVIDDLRLAQPGAVIYVFDNRSSDETAAIARSHGARVVTVSQRGKGNVVRAMLAKVDADIFLMIDGDATYPADRARDLIKLVADGTADMAVGSRFKLRGDGAFTPMHYFGNRLFCWLVAAIFGTRLQDVLSGYRAFSADVARSLPVVSQGFEVEMEMTIQALYYGLSITEIDIAYVARSETGHSKLNAFRDGAAILLQVFSLLRAYKPLTFFGGLGIFVLLVASALSVSAISGPNLASSSAGIRETLVLVGAVLITTGIVLHTLNFRIKELHSVLTRKAFRSR
jgi:glycosyltransferase involved in cell wall biosynthesis